MDFESEVAVYAEVEGGGGGGGGAEVEVEAHSLEIPDPLRTSQQLHKPGTCLLTTGKQTVYTLNPHLQVNPSNTIATK